ncbi:YwdI family protein [Cytobacillus depressus]|uniref:YwdI family protein n=1 Tax=Cytobacillus depressus TaxID=1602942 RepID=A0A6L3V4W0_9BACI|nr:YwdI family protein [Cytobacillus depressus]
MNISVQQLLWKMEEELKEAKGSATSARLRERVHAIKALCELILDEPAQNKEAFSSYVPPTTQQVQSSSIQQVKRMEMDDDANGESLFDF